MWYYCAEGIFMLHLHPCFGLLKLNEVLNFQNNSNVQNHKRKWNAYKCIHHLQYCWSRTRRKIEGETAFIWDPFPTTQASELSEPFCERWTLEVLLWLWTHLCSFQFHSSGRDQPEGAGVWPPHTHSLWEPKRPSAIQAFSPIDRDSEERQAGRFRLAAVTVAQLPTDTSTTSLMLNCHS